MAQVRIPSSVHPLHTSQRVSRKGAPRGATGALSRDRSTRLRTSAYSGSFDLSEVPSGMPVAGIPVSQPRSLRSQHLFDTLSDRPHQFLDAVLDVTGRLAYSRESSRGMRTEGELLALEDIIYLCMLAKAYSPDSELQDSMKRALGIGTAPLFGMASRKPIQLNNIQLLENCKGSYKVGAVVFNDAMTDELEKSVEQVRGFPQSEEDLAVSRALFASFRGVTREAWLRRFVEMDIYKVAKAFDLGPQAPEFSQKYASLPRFVAKAAYEAHCGEGYGYGRVEATLRRQAKRTRQRLSWKDRSQAYLDGGWATWRVESGRPVHVIESCPATAALQRHIDELFGPVDKNGCSDLVLTSQESYLHMVTEAERVGKALSTAEELLSQYMSLPGNTSRREFASVFRKHEG